MELLPSESDRISAQLGRYNTSSLIEVKAANCLIKKVLETGIVASNKKALEIEETYPGARRRKEGVRMRLNDGAEKGRDGQDGGAIQGGRKEGEGVGFG